MNTKNNDRISGLIKQHIKASLTVYLPYISKIVDDLLTQYPHWQLAFQSAIGLYGYYMALNQEELNEITTFIKDHPEQFREEIVTSKEFRKGFVIFMEEYLKCRIDRKKEFLKVLFLGFTIAGKKEEYDLERLNDCLVRISVGSLDFLLFFQKTIMPTIDTDIRKVLEQDRYKTSDRSGEWWYQEKLLILSIWQPIHQWLTANFDPGTEKVKNDYGQELTAGWRPDLQHKADTRYKEEQRRVHEALNELVTLGIIRSVTTSEGFSGGASNDYRLTKFGIEFLNLVKDVGSTGKS